MSHCEGHNGFEVYSEFQVVPQLSSWMLDSDDAASGSTLGGLTVPFMVKWIFIMFSHFPLLIFSPPLL